MERKQKIKILALSDISDFHLTEVLTTLDRLSRRHYDLIVVIGDLPRAVQSALDSIFESALIAILPRFHDSFITDSAGVEKFDLKRYKFSSRGTILGYGMSDVAIDKFEKYKADILVSVKPPLNFNFDSNGRDISGCGIVNRYLAFQKPRVLFHGGRKKNAITEIGSTIAVSVYGIREFTVSYMK